MSSILLEINDLAASVDDKAILKGIDLTVKPGEACHHGPEWLRESTLGNAVGPGWLQRHRRLRGL